jgi:hypothetical protein
MLSVVRFVPIIQAYFIANAPALQAASRAVHRIQGFDLPWKRKEDINEVIATRCASLVRHGATQVQAFQ